MAKMIVLKQEVLDTINVINNLKIDDMYVVMNEYEGVSTICQYSKKYDNFHIVWVKSDNLNKSLEMKQG